jgi:hypothetical protein
MDIACGWSTVEGGTKTPVEIDGAGSIETVGGCGEDGAGWSGVVLFLGNGIACPDRFLW